MTTSTRRRRVNAICDACSTIAHTSHRDCGSGRRMSMLMSMLSSWCWDGINAKEDADAPLQHETYTNAAPSFRMGIIDDSYHIRVVGLLAVCLLQRIEKCIAKLDGMKPLCDVAEREGSEKENFGWGNLIGLEKWGGCGIGGGCKN